MSSYNSVILVGNLARDPEARTTQAGQTIVNITVATSERWKDKATGEQKEKSEFTPVAIFNEHAARIAEQYLRKGSKCLVRGKLQTRKWQDQDGRDRWTTEVVIGRFDGELVLLGSRGEADGERSDQPARAGVQPTASRATGGAQGRVGGFSVDQLEDDIPFLPEWRA
jgi:single-strand DNA-binding protein